MCSPLDAPRRPLTPPFLRPPQVLPSLREHREEVLLRELYQRWNNHKLMVRWLSRFFNYLDRCGCGWGDGGWGPAAWLLACLHGLAAWSCMRRWGPSNRLRLTTLLLLCAPRYYVLRHSLHPLKDVGLLCFRGELRACVAS